jgi:hypothetical protein
VLQTNRMKTGLEECIISGHTSHCLSGTVKSGPRGSCRWVLFVDLRNCLRFSCCGEFTAVSQDALCSSVCITCVAGRRVMFCQQVRVCQVGAACSKAYNGDLPSVEVIVWGFVSRFSSYSVEFAWVARPRCVSPVLMQLPSLPHMWSPFRGLEACSLLTATIKLFPPF